MNDAKESGFSPCNRASTSWGDADVVAVMGHSPEEQHRAPLREIQGWFRHPFEPMLLKLTLHAQTKLETYGINGERLSFWRAALEAG